MEKKALLHPNGIQAILFDLDGTLRYNRPSSTRVFLDYAVKLGALDDPEKRQQATRWTHYYWAQSSELLEDIRSFDGQEDLFWTNYARRHLLAFDCTAKQAEVLAPQVYRYMQDEHQPEDWVPPEVPATLATLKESGFLLGVLSNRTQPCQEHLQNLGLDTYFSLAMVAGEVETWKPDPQIFHYALERLGSTPGETLYVGDNYYADVVGAQRAGLHPVLVDPEGIFPDPGCPVIRLLSELVDLLSSRN
jgi:putative hydrolase of the HAD superfamily